MFSRTFTYSNFSLPVGCSTLYPDGYNGKRKDNETYGEGNAYDYGARMYDSRLGRWFSLDVLQKKYAEHSPYGFCANNPILFVDPDGKKIIIYYKDENGVEQKYEYKPGIKPTVNNDFVNQVHEAVSYVMQNDESNTFTKLSESDRTVNIKFTNSLDAKVANQTNGKITTDAGGKPIDASAEIVWNPSAALENADDFGKPSGGAQAPSTLLLHEGDHALGILSVETKKQFEELKANSSPDNTSYDKPEEKRVISKVETNYIDKVNKAEALKNNNIFAEPQQQKTRANHRGAYYNATGVNSISRLDGKNIKGEKKYYSPIRIGGGQDRLAPENFRRMYIKPLK